MFDWSIVPLLRVRSMMLILYGASVGSSGQQDFENSSLLLCPLRALAEILGIIGIIVNYYFG